MTGPFASVGLRWLTCVVVALVFNAGFALAFLPRSIDGWAAAGWIAYCVASGLTASEFGMRWERHRRRRMARTFLDHILEKADREGRG